MKILSIGDIHGLDLWKDLVFSPSYDFDVWKISVDAGATPDSSLWNSMLYMQYDKIIFVGDYVDSFDISNEDIKKNLLDIIYFKKALPDKVVLLLGNHDVQYIVPNQLCTGFRGEMAIDLEQIFRENRDLFSMAHFEESKGVKWLWSHAGVTDGWLREAKDHLLKPDRFHAMNRPYARKEINEILNWLWETHADVLYQIDRDSGGRSMWASPLWVRPRMLDEHYVKKYNQIVGHTARRSFTSWDYVYRGTEYSIHYIDCLRHTKSGLILDI